MNMKVFPSLALLGVMLSCGSPDIDRRGLGEFVGQRLNPRSAKRIEMQYKRITGDDLTPAGSPLTTWWVKPFRSGPVEWMLLQAYPGYNVPDISGIAVHSFDKDWTRISRRAFPTGYRMYIEQVEIVHYESMAQDLLLLTASRSTPRILGNDKPDYHLRQYYGFVGDHILLIRLEDDKGQAIPNDYSSRLSTIGSRFPQLTKDDCIEALASNEPAEQLSTLVWLTGVHLRSTARRSEKSNQESVEDSLLYERVRDDIRTQAILEKIKIQSNTWVREYAELAQRIWLSKDEGNQVFGGWEMR